jgi:hypothetical protein
MSEEPTTKKVRVYGTEYLDVEMKINPNKLTAAQQKLVEQLRLNDYVEEKYKGQEIQGKQWIEQILDEIINKDCRGDPSLIAKESCPNFQAYLMHLALTLYGKRGDKNKLPYVKNEAVISQDEKDRRDAARKGKGTEGAEGAEGAEGGPEGKGPFGDLTLRIHIPMSILLDEMGVGGDELDALLRKILRTVPPLMEEFINAANLDPILLQLFQLETRIRKAMAKQMPELTAL